MYKLCTKRKKAVFFSTIKFGCYHLHLVLAFTVTFCKFPNDILST